MGAAARPLPYPPEQIRAVTLLADGGRLWLAVTAAVPIQHDHDLDPSRVAGVDLGIIHPYAVVTGQAGLLVSGRRCAPRTTSTVPISRPAAPRRHREHPDRASAAPGAGAATGPACGVQKPA
ncbi:MAG TPA: hypothetical protein VF880_12005, partial [Actinomycetes bacterium]